MISTIIAYKFTTLSRREIDDMLGLGTSLKQTRVYQEAQEEKAQEIAFNMIRENIPLEAVSRLTGLTIEQLQTLQSQAEQDQS